MSNLPPAGVSFRSRFDKDIGTGILIIEGLDFPANAKFSALSKIWSSVKKRIAESYDVHSTGLFFLREDNSVLCNFILNSAEKLDYPAHLEVFQNTFPAQMDLFQNAVEEFVGSRHFREYREYVESTPKEEIAPSVCDAILTDFLLSTGFKTVADEKAKMESAARNNHRTNGSNTH